MTISIKCPVCGNWFSSQESYDNHTPCSGSLAGASGSQSIRDKYAKEGTGRP